MYHNRVPRASALHRYYRIAVWSRPAARSRLAPTLRISLFGERRLPNVMPGLVQEVTAGKRLWPLPHCLDNASSSPM